MCTSLVEAFRTINMAVGKCLAYSPARSRQVLVAFHKFWTEFGLSRFPMQLEYHKGFPQVSKPAAIAPLNSSNFLSSQKM